MAKSKRSPSELRTIFGDNLRQLARKYASISELSRQLGINRTQFNRYLSGESFPRPDVLDQICRFFNVDARILLEPVGAQLEAAPESGFPIELSDFIVPGLDAVSHDKFPLGFYRVTSKSKSSQQQAETDLVYVFNRRGKTLIRGYSRPERCIDDAPSAREFRGFAAAQAEGLMLVMSHRNASAGMCVFVTQVSDCPTNTWAGYMTTVTPKEPGKTSAARVVFTYLGQRYPTALATARSRNHPQAVDEMTRKLLQPGQPFE